MMVVQTDLCLTTPYIQVSIPEWQAALYDGMNWPVFDYAVYPGKYTWVCDELLCYGPLLTGSAHYLQH